MDRHIEGIGEDGEEDEGEEVSEGGEERGGVAEGTADDGGCCEMEEDVECCHCGRSLKRRRSDKGQRSSPITYRDDVYGGYAEL